MFEHAVEDDQELTHASGQGHFLGLAGGTQTLVKRADHWVEACSNQSGHVQRSTDVCSTTPDDSPAPEGAAVSVKPESTEGGRLVSILKWPEGAPLNLG